MTAPLVFPTSVFQAAFGVESEYGSGTGSTLGVLGVLGVGMQIESFKQDNQFDALYRLGSRAAQLFYSQGIKVSTSAKFVMATDNKNWLDLVLNKQGSTTISWTIPDRVGVLPSAYMNLQDEHGYFYTASGFVVETASITFEQGKTCDVDLSMTGNYVTYSNSSTAPVSFSGGLTYPIQFTTWANVQVSYVGSYGSTTFSVQPITDLKIEIKNNPDYYYGLGSIDYVAFVPKKLDVTGSMTILHDSALIEHILTTANTQSSTNSYTFTITVGSEYGSPYIIELEGMYWDDGSMTFTPVDVVEDKFNFKARNIKVTT
ncbi:MAG: phage tail tube protein [Candidatus Parvarchaeum sp.]